MPKKQENQPQIPNTPLKYMWFLVKEQKGLVFFSVFVATLAELIGSSIPLIFRSIINTAQGVATGASTANQVALWALAFPIAVFLMDGFWRISGFTGMRWMTAANARSYKVLFSYLSKHSHTYFSDRFAGSLSSKVTHASEGAQSFYEAFLWNYYSGVLALLFTFIYIASVNVMAGGIFFTLLVILIPINIKLAKYRKPHVVAYSEQTTKARGRLVDTIANIGAVRQYSTHELEQRFLQGELNNVRSLNLKQWTISEWGLVTNNVLIALFELVLVIVTVTLWSKGNISTGDLVMVVTLLLNVNGTLIFIGNSINGFIRRYAEVEEGLTDILRPYEVTNIDEADELAVKAGLIDWKGVTFEFGENKVFDKFNLVIPSGQRVGLVGHSGAGKTTFVSLLLRQHDVTGGAIEIDGQNIAEVTQDSLRSAVAVVPQEPMLFHRTIRENIAYGKPDATEEEIVAVAKKAQAHDFISVLAEGYNTMVGERGIKLSGGQKQRVAIARAMLKNAPILILDEATSALDSESEVAIQAALHQLMTGKTVVAIAHRLSTLREMDRIIVLENGQIIEDGTHDSLKEAGGVYQRLWEHQAGGFLVE
ncbi:MAG: ABC transporter ATP-binding protein [Patescibacteria group bacterium]